MNEEEIKKIIEKIMHPEIDASLMELGMIKDIKIEGNKVRIKMAFPFPGVPIKYMLIEMVKQPLQEAGFEVEIEETIMNEEELQHFFKLEQEKWRY